MTGKGQLGLFSSSPDWLCRSPKWLQPTTFSSTHQTAQSSIYGVWVKVRDSHPYLIFLTNPTNISVEKKMSCGEISDLYAWQMWINLKILHMWSNFKFLHMRDLEKSEISPHLACVWCGECLYICTRYAVMLTNWFCRGEKITNMGYEVCVPCHRSSPLLAHSHLCNSCRASYFTCKRPPTLKLPPLLPRLAVQHEVVEQLDQPGRLGHLLLRERTQNLADMNKLANLVDAIIAISKIWENYWPTHSLTDWGTGC